MQRPFLVGQSFAGQSFADDRAVDQELAAQDAAHHDLDRRGLHLVPQPHRDTVMVAGHVGNVYKAVAVAAALFLVLTVF
jgi:Ni,Fe-hydrogenase III small subunit